MRYSTSLIVPTLLVGLPGIASAQNITVQQPVIRNFSVGTVVSVPDRGRAHLGSVSRAGESRSSYGPLRSGTSIGLFRNHAGVSTHVWIHDLRAMDEQILRRKRRSARIPAGRPLSRNAEHADRGLISRYRAHSTRSSAIRSRSVSGTEDPAAKFYRLGLRAEKRGKKSLARLHYRMAAKHGSGLAKRKLASGQLTARVR